MFKVGYIIKLERIKQKVKQSVLAKGICTPSYLSRIENDIVEPSEDIINLIFKKLDLNTNMIHTSNFIEDKNELDMIREIYLDTLLNRDKNCAISKLEYLRENRSNFSKTQSLYYMYLIVSIRISFTAGENIQVINSDIESLNEINDKFSILQCYLHLVNQAIYFYSINNIKQCIYCFEKAADLLPNIQVEPLEEADFNYMIGLAYAKDNQSLLAIQYIKKSLTFFKDNLLIKSIIDCYILIGIIYKRIKKYEESLDMYSKAEKLVNQFNLLYKKSIIYHNLGSLWVALGDENKGLNFYFKSLKSKENLEEKPITILAIIVEYSKKRDVHNVLYWCNEGLNILKKINNYRLFNFYYHYIFYKQLYETNENFEETTNEVLSFFENNEDFVSARKYSIALGHHYIQQKRYKKAAYYLDMANHYNYIDLKIEKWEEL